MSDYYEEYESKYIEVKDQDDDGDDLDQQDNQQNEEVYNNLQQGYHQDETDQNRESSTMQQNISNNSQRIESNSEDIEILYKIILGYQQKQVIHSINLEQFKNKSQYIQALFSTVIEDVKEHVLQNEQQLYGKEVLYGFIIWIIQQYEAAKLKSIQSYQKLQFKDQFGMNKLNSVLNLIHEHQNEYYMQIESVPNEIILLLLKLAEFLDQPNFVLTIFQWLRDSNKYYTPQIYYMITLALIRLNQLEEAEFNVHQILLLHEDDKQFEKSFKHIFIELAFQCYSDADQLIEFQKKEKPSKQNSVKSWFKFQLLFLQSMKRLGYPNHVRQYLYILGEEKDIDETNKFCEENLTELFELIIYTNRLPYISKLLYEPSREQGTTQTRERDVKALSYEIFENDPKNFLILFNQALIKRIANGDTEYKYILQVLQIGQEYHKLVQEAKDQYIFEMYNELDTIQQNKEMFIQKESQFSMKYVTKWIDNIQKSDESVLFHSLYNNNKAINYYISLINILKLSGQYNNIIIVIDLLYENFLMKNFPCFTDQFECFKLLNLVPKMLKQFYLSKPSRKVSDQQKFDWVKCYHGIFLEEKGYQSYEIERADFNRISIFSTLNQIQETQKRSAGEQVSQIDFTQKEMVTKREEQRLLPHEVQLIFKQKQLIHNNDYITLCEIMYTKALSLMYVKKYQESLTVLSQIIAMVIHKEGIYSYTLLPYLTLQSEVSTFLTEKTLAFLSQQCINKILNNLSDSEEDYNERCALYNQLIVESS